MRTLVSLNGVDIGLVAKGCDVSINGDRLFVLPGKGILLRVDGFFEALDIHAPNRCYNLSDGYYIYLPEAPPYITFYLDTHADHGIYRLDLM